MVYILVEVNRRDFMKGGGVALAMIGTSPLISACASRPRNTSPWSQLPDILSRIRPPIFPDRDFDITRYGAVGDGIEDCSDAIKQAITECAAVGGGRVVVPAGRFATGPIHLESNVNLEVRQGATLAFTKDFDRYLPPVFTRWSGIECLNYSPCIYAFGKTNIGVTGGGTLDGQASNENWWPWAGLENFGGWIPGTPNEFDAYARLKDMAERAVPVEQRVFGDGDMLRPMMIQPYRCTNVLIDGVSVHGSPMWAIHPVLCTNVTVRGVTVESHGPNNDGCNPESCTDVLIDACTFNTGDDCVAIKSGRNQDGRRISTPTANVIVRNCRMYDGEAALAVGSEVSGGVHHVFFDKCTVGSPKLERAVHFKNNAQRGALVEHVYFRDITITGVRKAALSVDFQYDEGAAGPYHPVLRDVEVSQMRSTNAERVMELLPIPSATIRDVRLTNCVFDNVKAGSVIENTTGITLSDVRVNGRFTSTLSDLTF